MFEYYYFLVQEIVVWGEGSGRPHFWGGCQGHVLQLWQFWVRVISLQALGCGTCGLGGSRFVFATIGTTGVEEDD